MTTYHVRFVKTLCDDTGHQHKCLQAEIEVSRARTHARAVRAAELKFQRVKRIENWKTYADVVEVVD
jgi:hypothetical protein